MNEGTGPQGFTRDVGTFEAGASDDEAVVDRDLVNDEDGDEKSEEPDDGESLDDRVDE